MYQLKDMNETVEDDVNLQTSKRNSATWFSLYRFWRFVIHLLTYLLTYLLTC